LTDVGGRIHSQLAVDRRFHRNSWLKGLDFEVVGIAELADEIRGGPDDRGLFTVFWPAAQETRASIASR